jgi:hypothetical protein
VCEYARAATILAAGPGSLVAPRATSTLASGLPGSVDPGHGLVSIGLPLSVFNHAAGAQPPLAAGSVLTSLRGVTTKDFETGDTVSAPGCTYSLS